MCLDLSKEMVSHRYFLKIFLFIFSITANAFVCCCCCLRWNNNVSRHNTHSSLTECHARTRLARYRVYKIDLYREKTRCSTQQRRAAGDGSNRVVCFLPFGGRASFFGGRGLSSVFVYLNFFQSDFFSHGILA